MYEMQITLSRVLTIGLWFLVVGLLAASWAVGMFGDWRVAALLGFTACSTSAAAAVSQIRGYALKVCALIRASATIEAHSSPGSISSIR